MTEILLDSSVLIDFLQGEATPQANQIVEKSSVAISIITFMETCKYWHQIGRGREWDGVKDRLSDYRLVFLHTTTAELAARLASSQGLSLADSIIYATALYNRLPLVTSDKDFKNKKGVILVKK